MAQIYPTLTDMTSQNSVPCSWLLLGAYYFPISRKRAEMVDEDDESGGLMVSKTFRSLSLALPEHCNNRSPML